MRVTRSPAPILILIAAFLAGCPTREVSRLDPSPSREALKDVLVSNNRNVDILFVIDNSNSMKDKQDTLATNFPRFIDVLNTIEGGLPNVHIGVVSSDVGIAPFAAEGCTGNGDNGVLQNTPRGSCVPPSNGARFIEDILLPGGVRSKNYTGNIDDAFTCIAKLGVAGCGFENHLESMKRALDGSNPQNAGFLREDAYLAVIIVADEDDCSARDTAVFNPAKSLDNVSSAFGPYTSYRCTEFGVTCDNLTSLPRTAATYTACQPRGDSYLWHPQHYVDFIKSLKPDPSQIVVAVVSGNSTPFATAPDASGNPALQHSCQTTINGHLNVADPGVRLKYFADQFFPLGKTVTICKADFSEAMQQIASLLITVLGDRCVDGDIDTTDVDADAPGLQLDCSVSDVRYQHTDREEQTVVPRCAMQDASTPAPGSPQPCWWARIDATACPTAKSARNLELSVERGGVEPVIGTHLVVRCATL